MRVDATFRSKLLWLLATLIVLALSCRVGAEIYTYVDEKGVLHFTNVPVKQGSKALSDKALRELKKELQVSKKRFFMTASLPSTYRAFSYSPVTSYARYASVSALQSGIKPFPAFPSPYEKSLEPYINALASEHGLDPKLVKAVIRAESAFNPSATSPRGAMGLMQLMPGTAMDMGVQDPYHPVDNLKGGIGYLKEMLRLFDNNLVLALAAYNAGPNAVKQYGGVPPYEETRQYIQRVLQYYSHYKATP